MHARADKGLLFEYIKILLGKTSSFSSVYFSRGVMGNNRTALEVFRYAIEYFLHWTPEQTKTYLNADVIKKLKLDKVMVYVSFPPGLDLTQDYWYIAHLLYPKQIPCSLEDTTLYVYKRLLKGPKDGGLYRFPKHFFDGNDGRKRACICFRYLLAHYEVFDDIKSMYEFFSTEKGEKELDKYGLRLVWRNVFESPVLYLHETLPVSQRNELYYHFYECQYQYRLAINTKKKLKALAKIGMYKPSAKKEK